MFGSCLGISTAGLAMFWRGQSSVDGAAASSARKASEENDEAIARSLAQAEIEQADALLAERFMQASSPTSVPSGQSQKVQCGVCQMMIQVAVPCGVQPGMRIKASCPRCTADNLFRIPSPSRHSPVVSPPFRDADAQGLISSAPPAPTYRGDELIYVACEIGSTTVEIMVDTGAQSSVISMPLVKQLNLTRHLDSSHQGVAAGVGTARILGKLRGVPVKLGHVEFALDFSVLAVDDQLLLLGIDQLRRFKCIVDLERQRLVFGGRDGVEVSFLPPSTQRLSYREGCPVM